MARKFFISYKYSDILVNDLNMIEYNFFQRGYVRRDTRVRDYVDKLQEIIGREHINLGEKDGESLADFKDSTIWSKLKTKIWGSSITIVMISKGMKMLFTNEKDQWIPWEISYSLRETMRDDRISRMNAILGIVLPDENNSYEWYYTQNILCDCTTHHTDKLFGILQRNMFNMKEPVQTTCNGLKIHHGEFSFIKTVKWNDFLLIPNVYIEKAIEIRKLHENYTIYKNVD